MFCSFQTLMVESSPIGDFYPVEFEQDLNGKRQDWEAVVLIPFIDEVCYLTCLLHATKYSELQ